MHYRRWRLYGTPGVDSSTRAPNGDGQNLDSILRHFGWTITNSGCWEWLGRYHKSGYGEIRSQSNYILSHRASYMAWVGPIGDFHVLHRCDNRKCINPQHLFLGTNADNVADKIAKGRQARGSKNHSKLSECDVKEIRGMLTRCSNKEIASKFGVDPSVVSKIKHGQRWTHV